MSAEFYSRLERGEIQVVVDRSRLEAYRISLAEVVAALGRENVDAPAGAADRGATQALVRVAARGRCAEQIAEIPVKHINGAAIPVRYMAQVIDGVEETRNLALLNDRPALAVDIQKQSGANTVSVSDGVREAVAQLNAGQLRPGVSLRIVVDQSSFIREAVEDVQWTRVVGGLLTILIVPGDTEFLRLDERKENPAYQFCPLIITAPHRRGKRLFGDYTGQDCEPLCSVRGC